MCGLFGMMLKPDCSISAAQRGVITFMLSDLNDTRGKDSWGFAAVNEDGGIVVRHGMGYLSFKTGELLPYDRFFAHTRYATQGKRNLKNAHPFMIGRIIGAHNGCLWNHDELNKKWGRHCSVDSMHLMHHLDGGHDFDDIEGYGVLEWYEDNDSSCIYLCQLTEGADLSIVGIGTTENIEGVIWSSDAKHLRAALECAGVKQWFNYEIHPEQVYYAKPEGLFFVKRRKLHIEDYGPGNSGYSVHSNRWGTTDSRGNGWFARPNNLSDEEWEEWKAEFLGVEEDDERDLPPEIKQLDCRLMQHLEEEDEDEDGIEVVVEIEEPSVPKLITWGEMQESVTRQHVRLDEERRRATSMVDDDDDGYKPNEDKEYDEKVRELLDAFGCSPKVY